MIHPIDPSLATAVRPLLPLLWHKTGHEAVMAVALMSGPQAQSRVHTSMLRAKQQSRDVVL